MIAKRLINQQSIFSPKDMETQYKQHIIYMNQLMKMKSIKYYPLLSYRRYRRLAPIGKSMVDKSVCLAVTKDKERSKKERLNMSCNESKPFSKNYTTTINQDSKPIEESDHGEGDLLEDVLADGVKNKVHTKEERENTKDKAE